MPLQNQRAGRILIGLFILTAALCAAASGQEAVPLLPGSPVERELSGGQAHVYLLRLEAGQFLDLVVDQHGIDVEVLLTGPDGKLLEQVDSPNGDKGPEPLKLLTEQAGVYRLEIRALNKDARPGRYEAKINELRTEQTSDRDVIRDFRIGQLFSGAAALTSQGTGAALRQSIELLEKAASLLRQTNNHQQLANALLGIGQRYTRLGDAQKGVEYYRQALPLYAESGNHNGQAMTLNSLGLALGLLGQIQQAEEAYEQSLQLRRESGDRKALGVGLMNLGDFYSRKGEPQRAIDYFTEALQTGRELKDDDMIAYACNNLGVNYAVIGDKQRAREYLSEAVPIFRRTGDRRMEVAALTSLSRVVAGEDRPQQFETLKQALKVYRELGEQRGEAGALNNLGQVAAEMGNRDEALDYFNQSLALMQKMHNTQGEALVYLSLGRFSFDKGDLTQSLDYFTQSLTLQRELQNPAGEARALLGIARAERARGNLSEARHSIEQAITIIEELRTRLAGQEQRSAYLASVQDYYELYVDLLMQQQRTSRRDSVKGEDYVALALQASERARARSLRELLLEARFDIRQGADPELLRQEKRLQQELNSQLERQMQLLSNPHSPAQAAAVKKATADIRSRLQDVETQIRRQSPRYAALTQPQMLTLTEIQKVLPDSETLLLEYLLGKERSYLWVVGPQSVRSYELPGRERIEAAARRVLDLLTARNQGDANEAAALRRARIARADAQYWQAAAQLSRMILSPAARQLGRKRLLIVADGPLQYVPFAALPECGMRNAECGMKNAPNTSQSGFAKTAAAVRHAALPLIARHEIISLPSASVLVEARRATARQSPPAKTVAVLADPVFEANDDRITTIRIAAAEHRPAVQPEQTRVLQQRPGEVQVSRLPFTRAEADRILKLVPAGASLRALDFKASRATAMSEQLGEYRIVHFATHGYFDAENPELSRLLFSRFDESGRPQPWALSAPEIFNLKLPADLVVLSGCRTALGKSARGEGIGVLTRGFMYAGAARVLASLWNVSDQGTAELMGRFYEGLLGPPHERPGAALRAAQLSLLRRPRWQSPYYWAAFVLQGEW